MPDNAAKLVSLGAAATAVGGAYKLGEFLYKAKRLRDVGPANAVYVRLINRVRLDLDEVRRLLAVREVHDALEANPEKSKWVYGAMRDVRGALENITPHTERVASDIEEGRRVGVRHRVYWLLSEKEKLENREKELHVAHASLNEVIGYLTALEPNEAVKKEAPPPPPPQQQPPPPPPTQYDTRNTRVDIDIRQGAPQHEHVREEEVWVERNDRGPRRVEEHWVEHEHRGPHRHEEHWVQHEHHHGARPGRYEERETWVDERGPRRFEQREYYDERRHDRYDERGLEIERDPRDPNHVEARYYQSGPDRFEEKRYEERRMGAPLGRRPESFEDRVPERDTWMQSSSRAPYGQYAEYGAPQPIGAANYRRRFLGDPGFGDEIVVNPQPVPPTRDYEREIWIEEREDFRYDEYGNRLPDRMLPPKLRSRM
ncbi:hypothetical protein BS50DRAFT_342080 [Corynespora cassiicola Philippines]|uniref:Uncharacterized protein n=1 Tax=Corynespora cassiicola Philippines TaxID=1448308 RepID=A0A2T2NVZ2_CORCC|nr:hypothetical protein BS50DRAFT_342080 [Corynespora cassiicola Philippines]